MLDFIAIGDCGIDVFHLLRDHEINVICRLNNQDCQLCLSYADKIPVTELQRMPAGNAANVAVGASRLGWRSALVSFIGNDEPGRLIRTKLEEEGVVTDYLTVDQDGPTNYSTVLSYEGERTILVYHAPRRYRLPKFTKPKWIYLTSMAKGSEVLFPELAHLMREDGVKLVFQPGTFQLRLGLEPAKELLSYTEVIILNKEEAELYLSLPPGTDKRELVRGLLAVGPRIAVVTDAKAGAVAGSGHNCWSIATRPEIPRKEATGAGDAFATGFTAALMSGADVPTALRWGTLNAESVIQQIGPQAGLLTREAMEAQLAANPELQAKPL